MDKIEFKIVDCNSAENKTKSVTILINGKDLIGMLREYEIPFAKSEGNEMIAGDYGGLTPETLIENLTKSNRLDENCKTSILECECGCEGCWPMKLKVTQENSMIIWDDFEQPHRNVNSPKFWDYKEFGKFVFSIDNYNEELNKMKVFKL